MKNDLDLTFGEIFNNDPKAFLDQLIDIQTHTANRRKAEKWVDQLRLIDISGVPDITDERGAKFFSYTGQSSLRFCRPTKPLVLPLLEKTDDDGDIPYIAVSWRWTRGNQPPQWGYDARESYDYRIQRPGREPHKSQFPDHYFERVIMYAQNQGIDRLWIDKESVYQEDDEDRSLGVQIMDAVYEGSDLSVGLLTTPLMHQNEIDLLAELLSGLLFQPKDDTAKPKYGSRATETALLKIQTLILRILSDSRWSRGWIFQEDHLSSDRMRLLIPYSKGLKLYSEMYDFGKLPGNLVVKLSDFRKAVTEFCIANSENEHRWPVSEMLGKAKHYNTFNRRSSDAWQHPRNEHMVRVWTDGEMSLTKMNKNEHYIDSTRYPSTTLSILDDICHRDLEKTEDRIAIMANASKFSKRLDTSRVSPLVTSETYSLSAILLTLILLNGVIVDTDHVQSHKDLMYCTLRQYIENVQYLFYAPSMRYEQSFIDHCRLKETEITRRGVEAPGFLFKLLPNRKPFSSASKPHPLKLTAADRQHLKHVKLHPYAQVFEPGRKFNMLAEDVIMVLVRKLRKNYGKECKLAEFIHSMLCCDAEPPPPEEALPSTPYVLDNMVGLVQALIDDRELRLARLDSEPDTTEPSAIFIAPPRADGWFSESFFKYYDVGTGDVWVFTSWDNGWRNHGMERLSCLEVAPFTQGPNVTDVVEYSPQWDSDPAANSFLRSYGWINGVWNIEGKHMSKYTFPIAGLTSPQSPPYGDLMRMSPSPQMPDDGEGSITSSSPATRRCSKRKRNSNGAELSE